MQHRQRIIPLAAILSAALIAGLLFWQPWRPQRPYTAQELGIPQIQSLNDKDEDELEDYMDMVEGARTYIATDPHYESKYYAGGYPDDGKGVCTDVIWNAFLAAGYDLKGMVDMDVGLNPDLYPAVTTPDPNIDFRRVRNLNVFFSRHAQSLTTSLQNPAHWQPGDIVIFDGHIALCSDLRNEDGIPYIIHHGNARQGAVETDDMLRCGEILAHYRWIG